jgi:hypothetical protein
MPLCTAERIVGVPVIVFTCENSFLVDNSADDVLVMERGLAAVRALPPRGAAARELRLLRRESIAASTRLAGSALTAAEVSALLDRGTAVGGRAFADYVLVREYADAAAYAWSRRAPIAPSRAWAAVDELRRLHTLVVRSEPDALPGAWRNANVAPAADGLVPPPYWIVPREVQALVERVNAAVGVRPDALVVAEAVGRLARIAPFPSANGRVARLFADVLLARRGYPPFAIDDRRRAAYLAAVGEARDGRPAALAAIVAHAVARALRRMEAALRAEPLAPLADLVAPEERAAAYKAAQRGRLSVVERDGRTYSTAAWLDAYRATRSAAGRPPTRRAASSSEPDDVIE